MNYFISNNEEKELIKFIAKYQYLNTNDAKYFFSSTMYYKKRIHNLIERKFLKKIKRNLVLDKAGINYVEMCGFEYNKLNRNTKYLPRLLYISNIAAFYHNSDTVIYTPSFKIKNPEEYTNTARRYIGIFDINNTRYLAYHIPEDSTKQYISSVIYDIQKEKDYKNIIIFTDTLLKINIENFVFGMNKVLIIEDTTENREKLKYMNNINWSKVIHQYYKNKVYLSEYSFCEYTDYKNKYINLFSFLDAEKINIIKYFLRENKDKNVTIICDIALQKKILEELPICNYITINLEDYVERQNVFYV